MMNNTKKYNTCEIVGDLLPLYADNVCSNDSRELVEEHIKSCERCRSALEATRDRKEESLLGAEKKNALTLHGKRRDVRTLKSILFAIAAAYVPLVFIAPLFVNDTGLAPTNYPFKLLVVFLYTLPFLTSIISLGFTASKIISDGFSARSFNPADIIGAVAAIVTLISCFKLNDLLYPALFCSAVNIIIWIVTAVKKGTTVPIHKKTFFFCFFVVFTVFLALIIALNTVANGTKRPERDEYAASYTTTAL